MNIIHSLKISLLVCAQLYHESPCIYPPELLILTPIKIISIENLACLWISYSYIYHWLKMINMYTGQLMYRTVTMKLLRQEIKLIITWLCSKRLICILTLLQQFIYGIKTFRKIRHEASWTKINKIHLPESFMVANIYLQYNQISALLSYSVQYWSNLVLKEFIQPGLYTTRLATLADI